MYIDWLYIILVLPAAIISLIASARVKTVFDKYSRVPSGCTGAEAAEKVLEANGLRHIRIERVSGKLTDHYDPTEGVIRLSEGVYDSRSCAAVGVAAHEAGHAVQHAEEYFPAKLRSAIVPITNFGSRLSTPLIIIGIVLSYFSVIFSYVAYAGVACFSLCVIFQLVTLPTEFNASRRALAAIEDASILEGEALVGARRVLSAAAMTYLAALAVSLMQLLRLLIIVGSGSRRRR